MCSSSFTNAFLNSAKKKNGAHAGLTEANGEMAFSPDAEIKEEVLVELLQQWAVAIRENLLQQQLAGH